MNRQVYDNAYKRVLEGKPSRTLWETVLAPFEDVDTRMSREAGEREARAVRETMQAEAQARPD